ncbi:MAG TPA: hypothetical protein VMW36_06740 [Patescibacteria group bacterium]|nr:hypothetical protein [Patescibacteria group bacterium]
MSQNRKDGVTDADILKTLKDSGYPLEQEIASILEKMGWDCTLNYAFTDVETNVSRETDILAQRDMTLERHLKNLTESAPRIGDAESKSRWRSMNERVRLHVEVIVECKKVTSPVVFFCRNKQPKDLFPMYADDMVQYSGVKSEITVKPWNELSTHTFTLGQFLEFGKICHYAKCKEKATQFCKVF